MIVIRFLLTMVLIAGVPAFVQAAKDGKGNRKPNPAKQREEAKQASLDQLATEAFTASDRNHNGALNRSEFSDAEAMLETSLMQLGQQGVLGRHKGQDSQSDLRAAIAGPPKFANKNRITLPEFKRYTESMTHQAEAAFAQVHAAQKAQQQQARRYRVRRVPVRTGVPYPVY